MNLQIDKRYITLDEITKASNIEISKIKVLDYINHTHDFWWMK